MSLFDGIHGFLFGRSNGKSIKGRTYSWNLASSIAYSIQSVLLLLVVTRIGGLDDAGRFSIYYITTTMLASVGSFSMRNYQVSDARDEFSYDTYFTSRFSTCALMILLCLLYAVIWQPSLEGIATVLSLGIYRLSDGMEDVVHGEMQKQGRLDAASIARTARISLSFVAFTVAYAIACNMTVASIVMAACSLIVMAVNWVACQMDFPQLYAKFSFNGMGRLLLACLPICASAVLYNYIANLPRYAIEATMTSEYQGIFNILFMPVFAVSMLSTVVYNPVVSDMGVYWQTGDLRSLKRIVLRQVVVIAALSIACSLCGFLIGCPILGLIYGVDLSQWNILLAVLLLLGGVSALASFGVVLLTVMRHQALIIVGYLVAVGSSFIYLESLTKTMGLFGAGYSYGILMGIAAVFFALVATIAFINRGKHV